MNVDLAVGINFVGNEAIIRKEARAVERITGQVVVEETDATTRGRRIGETGSNSGIIIQGETEITMVEEGEGIMRGLAPR